MEIWQIVLIVLMFIGYFYVQNYLNDIKEKQRIHIPLFTPRQLNEMLDRRGPETVEEAFTVLKGEYGFNWNNVLKAASILGNASGADYNAAVTELISMLDNEDPNLRAISAVSLGKLKDPSAVPALQRLLESQPTEYQLGQHKSMLLEKEQQEAQARRSGATLVNYPSIPDPQEKHQKVREAAAWAINQILQSRPPAEVQEIIVKKALVHQAFKDLGQSEQIPYEKRIEAIAALSEATGIDLPTAHKLLIAQLENSDQNVVLFSVLVLSRIGDNSTIPQIKRVLGWTPPTNTTLIDAINNSIKEIESRNH